MQINRIEFLKEMEEEKLLRESIRRVISTIKQRKKTKLKEQQNDERYLRAVVRRLIKEAETADVDPSPGRTTGINVLEDLLKKIIPVLQDDYKQLTTDEQQRESFRAHILNAVMKTLKPIEVSNTAGAGGEAGGEEELELEL